MILSSLWAMRLLGLSGILGAVLFCAGDLLYNHVPGSDKNPAEKMSTLAESRLLNAGTLGLIGCWFYTLGAGQVYIAFHPVGETFSLLLFLAFAAVMICYGISHTAYFSIAAGAKMSTWAGAGAEMGASLGSTLFQRLVFITYVPVVIASGMMIYGILGGQSMYPRWMAVFLPVVIYLLKTPVTRLLRGRARELIRDSYDNVSLLVFFVISTLVLWNGIVR